jgi:hypothetical protein
MIKDLLMSDIVYVATIVLFFLAAALLVRLCDRITANSVAETGPPDEDVTLSPHAELGRPR